MKIDPEYLPYIFEHDLLYLAEERKESLSTDQKPASKTQKEPEKPDQFKEESIAYTTATQSRILILVDTKFGEQEKTLLQNILKALNADISEVEVVKQHPADFKPKNGIKLFISFDDALVKNANYEMNKIHNTQIIYAHSLSTLEGQKPLKMQLWKLLKELN